ncbi:hypothetical protein OF83DRAFT_1172331 [Amylostereum chailletii]|nr:hypothetical protein OF83DRAFT_1172331 [Amylostereum chailletii]
MPVSRLNNKRRRSSAQLTGLKSSKLGRYTPTPRIVTFAPNVTPVSFLETETDDKDDDIEFESKLFPPSEKPSSPSRKRQPKGKRRSQGYIPRPPNAFMLFRADFVRQKHVPGTIETNHTSLSRIIGNCWQSLPLDERKVWEIKAKHAKAEHKAMYPNYRFKPVHNRSKEKKVKTAVAPEDEQRCEEVAQLLLEGMKGEELEEAVKRLDRVRSETPATHRTTADNSPAPPPYSPGPMQPLALPRRPSSVPLPGSFPFPSSFPPPPFAPFGHRQDSLDFGFLDFGRIQVPRRPSSVQPIGSAAWVTPDFNDFINYPMPTSAPSPLPEMNMSLFNPAYHNGPFPDSHPSSQNDGSFDVHALYQTLPSSTTISPLDNGSYASQAFNPVPPNSGMVSDSPNWPGSSVPSSIYSGSPAPSDSSLPILAPQPQHAFEAPPPVPELAPAPVHEHGKFDYDMSLHAYTHAMPEAELLPGLPNHFPHSEGPVFYEFTSGSQEMYGSSQEFGIEAPGEYNGPRTDFGGPLLDPASAIAAAWTNGFKFDEGQTHEY